MTVDIADPAFPVPVVDSIDLDRAVELVRQVCRIPSVLGDERALAEFLAAVMRDSGFESVELQPLLPNRPNAIGDVSFGPGPRVVLTGHLDTKPASIGWERADPISCDLVIGAVYGNGDIDMQAALACPIAALVGARAAQLPCDGPRRVA